MTAHRRTPAPILDTRGPDPGPPRTDTQPIDLSVDGTQAVAWLCGDIDLATSADVHAHGALALADPRIETLIIDVSRVSFLDSTGLGAFIHLRNQATQTNKRLALRGITPAVRKILEITQLDELFGSTADDPGRC